MLEYTQRMKAIRTDADETQAEVAYMLGITQQQYGLYETKRREIPVELLKQFCEHYGVSADYILGLPKGLSWPR